MKNYPLPKLYLNGTLAEMSFWHCVYYFLASRGRKTNAQLQSWQTREEINPQEFVELSGLSRQALDKFRSEVLFNIDKNSPYHITEEQKVLAMNKYQEATTQDSLLIPCSFIQNGWLKTVNQTTNSRLGLAILNVLFRTYSQKDPFVDFRELRKRAKQPQKREPEIEPMETALTQLTNLGIIQTIYRNGEIKYALNTSALDTIPTTAASQPIVYSSELTQFIQQKKDAEPEKITLLLKCETIGRFDLNIHYQEIWRDLFYLRPPEYYLLEQQLQKVGQKLPAGDKRWQLFWADFGQIRRKATKKLASTKQEIDCSAGDSQQAILFLPTSPGVLLFAKLVVWVDDPDMLLTQMPIYLTLYGSPAQIIWQTTIGFEQLVLRGDITQAVKANQKSFTLQAQYPQPLPSVRLIAQLEGDWQPHKGRF